MLYVFFEGKDSAHRCLRIWTWFADLPRLVLSWVVLPSLAVFNAALLLSAFWSAPIPPPNLGLHGAYWFALELYFILLWASVWLSNTALSQLVQVLVVASGFVRNRVWSFGPEGIWSTWLVTIRSIQAPIFHDLRFRKPSVAIPYRCDLEEIRVHSSPWRLLFRGYHSFYYRSPGIAKMIGLWIRKESESRHPAV
jgi:hypothetical protein